MSMFAAKLLASPMRQSVGPTTCRALAHTDIQFPDYTTLRQPSIAGKKNVDTEDQRKVFSYLMTESVDGSNAINTKSSVTNLVPTPQLVTQYFDQFDSYCQMINDAKSVAKRSILIDHCGLDHIDLTEFKNVEHIYSIEKETKLGFSRLSLIEFRSEHDAEKVAKHARHNEGLLPVPLKIFRYSNQAAAASPSPNQLDLPCPIDEVRLTYRREFASNFDSYTEFISNNVMSLLDLKMRFITLVNFERILCAGMFEEYELMPFGSSVIDLGCDSCDLDLVVTRKQEHHEFIKELLTSPKKLYNPEAVSKLVHLDKSLYSEVRDPSGIRGTMRWFDYILREYMPLTDGYGVLFLRNAKVPIIKFTSRITSLDCDLSFDLGLDHRVNDVFLTNYSGIIMSQIIYSMCRNNNIFSAVAIYLRIFGKLTLITSKGPNVGLTNFQFLSLILFYLQQISITGQSSKVTKESTTKKPELRIERYQSKRQKPIVPSFRELLTARSLRRQESSSIELYNDQLNQLLPDIIIGFFKFYSNFDFSDGSMNLYESKLERKLDNSSIYVSNPLDKSRNICHNVNRKGLDQFVQQIRSALESCQSKKETPLTLIESLMKKYQKQAKKNHESHYDLRGGRLVSTTEGIAQDIFR